MYHWRQLWSLALAARNRSVDVQAQGPQFAPGDTVLAVIMSVTACEAFINEMATAVEYFLRAKDYMIEPPDNMVGFATSLHLAIETNTDLRMKYQLASITMTGRPFVKGAKPYQEFDDLVKTRNWLVHLTTTPPKTIKALHQAGRTRSKKQYTNEKGELVEDSMSDFNRLLTSEVAEWACAAAFEMMGAILRMFPDRTDDPTKLFKLDFDVGFQRQA